MADEDVEKKMEFIIEQQTQFASKIGQLEDIVTRLATASLNRFETTEAGISQRFEDVEEKIVVLVDSQIKLTEAQSRTDENLRTLVAVVDRYFSEGRNGKAEA
ncbi:MAG TPA: hypothetical protein VGC64_04100 [Pyrinomonadaceae bacterium]